MSAGKNHEMPFLISVVHFLSSFATCPMGWSLLKFPWNYLRWPCAHLPGGPLICAAELGQQQQGQTKTLEFDLQFLSKMLVSQARSDQFAFKSNIPSPARFEQIKHNSSSLQHAKSTVSPSLIAASASHNLAITSCTVWPRPAESRVNAVLFPQATAQPSLRRSTVMEPLTRTNLGVRHSFGQRWGVTRCHLVHQCYIHQLQQDCHSGEVRCDIDLQTLGCMRFRPRVECRTVHRRCFQKKQHVHRFGEGVYDANLQTPGCRTFPHLLMKCYIVRLLQMASPKRMAWTWW